MRDGVTISTFELFKLFPDQETARTYLESRLWPGMDSVAERLEQWTT